ncbi:hypothetical protein Poly24_42460 [Rosistilla carotiformis]|uniref:Uncharacterized protein n=1 Tax=Rosistilla carotiformis TaxID=2528017 RepID=A0A518JYA6_9BACT|nr:hypothetical protein [Rosistilla carotiformis]QDV70522.1 hypothetical protein Poly24_42460 [Rosistilla carotiformis]
MEPRIVDQVERQIEAALAKLFEQPSHASLPLHPSRKTLHLMAKAAATVFETAVENRPRDKGMRAD